MRDPGGSGGCGYLGTRSGAFKIVTIIFGGVSVGLGSYGHFESFYIWKLKEEAFIASTASCFAISLFYFLAHLASEKLTKSGVNKIIDFIFHLLSFILLAIVGGLVVESTVEIDRKICRHFPHWPYSVPCQLYEIKLTASVIAIVNGILYGISALLIISD